MLIERYLRRKLDSKPEREEGVLWVTDLTACPLRTEFSKTLPEFNLPNSFTVWGEFAHKGFQMFLREEFGAETEVEGEKTLLDENGLPLWTVRGRADALLGDEIIEIKTAKSASSPFPHHVDQLRTYLWLFEKERGRLVYLTPDRVFEHEVRGAFNDEEVKGKILIVVQQKRVPLWDWECNYCPYAGFCPKRR